MGERDGEIRACPGRSVPRVNEDLFHLLKDETYLRANEDARPAGPRERSDHPEEQEGSDFEAS